MNVPIGDSIQKQIKYRKRNWKWIYPPSVGKNVQSLSYFDFDDSF
jgi:hypothetical protein